MKWRLGIDIRDWDWDDGHTAFDTLPAEMGRRYLSERSCPGLFPFNVVSFGKQGCGLNRIVLSFGERS